LELLAVVHGKKQGVRGLRSSLGDHSRELLSWGRDSCASWW